MSNFHNRELAIKDDQLNILIEEGAIFYCSHSGGKDSQAMYALLCQLVPLDQIVVVHANLGEVEWSGVIDHINATIRPEHHPVNVVEATWADGSSKTLLGMVERRLENRPDSPSWPSSAMRFCTSDLKRDPIAKFIKRDLKERGGKFAVNCMGLRAEESSARAKRAVWSLNKRMSIKSRAVYDWNPIHEWSTKQVFQHIYEAGQKPFWAYAGGNERLSCVFCIMGSRGDIAHGARVRPELLQKYVALEEKTGYTMFNGESVMERAGLIATDGGTAS